MCKAQAMYVADEAVVVPPANDARYIDALLAICREYEINLLCSLHDLDVFVLSQYRDVFEQEGIRTTLPSREWGRIALDKYECARMLEKAGISVPATFLCPQGALSEIREGSLKFPLVVKARLGFGSLGLRICRSEQELRYAYTYALEQVAASGTNAFFDILHEDSVIIQPAIQGAEVCLGVCNDFAGQYRAHFTCEVHSMRAGESDSATSIEREPFEGLARGLSTFTQHPGIWGVDLLDDNGIYRVIDVNPRFTGDYPFHHLAGCDIPRALLQWASGGEAPMACFEHTPRIAGYKDLVPRNVSC